MTAPIESQGGSPADPEAGVKRPRRRGARRRRSGWLLLAVGLLWLLGNGMGWFGSAPRGERGPEGEAGRGGRAGLNKDLAASVDEGPDPADLAKAAQVSDPPLTPDVVLAGVPAGVPAGIPAGLPASSPTPESPPAPPVGMAKDRFDSLVSLLELHIEEQELGRAAGVLQRLQAQSLTAAQRSSLTRLVATLRPLRDAAERRVLADVRRGDVLSADGRAQQLVVGDQWHAPTLLAAVAERDLGLGGDWQRALAADRNDRSAQLPASVGSSPLARNRQVRVRWRDQLRPAVVANSRLDQVTVRLRTGEGQSFPTVAATACEPTGSTADEAIEMGFAAVRANAPRLARLWLLRASLLREELGQRGRQLLQLLR